MRSVPASYHSDESGFSAGANEVFKEGMEKCILTDTRRDKAIGFIKRVKMGITTMYTINRGQL